MTCSTAITPVHQKNRTPLLIMVDKLLDTIPKQESDEFIKSCVENLVQNPSESEDFSEDECECDVPDCDDSQTTNFSTFSNPLFDDSTSSDNESFSDEDQHVAKLMGLGVVTDHSEYNATILAAEHETTMVVSSLRRQQVAFGLLRDALSVIFGLSGLK
ncbi:hypothetical protein Tco_0278459, partial [Tanacetum coccineum]